MSIDTTVPPDVRGGTASWVLAALATAVLAVVLGVFGSIGVLIDPLAAEFDAPRSQLVLLFAAALSVHSVTARAAGRAMDRWGPRPPLAVAAAGMGVGLLAPATAPTVWVAIGGYGLGLGLASATTWVATTAAVSAVSAAARLGAGWLATPRTLPLLYRACHVLVAAAFVVWALTGGAAAPPMLLAVAVLFGAGYGAWLSLGPAMLASTYAPHRLGRALGTLASVVGIGGVIGPVLAAPLLATAPAALLGGCALTALAAAAALQRRDSPQTPP